MLIVGHLGGAEHHTHDRPTHEHGDQKHADHEHHHPAEASVTAATVTARLDPASWDIVTATEQARTLTHGDRQVTLHDVIVRARGTTSGP